MRQANVLLDRNFTIGRIDPRLFGAFVEHLGRWVYGGIYEPGHPTADERGFRRDVLDLVQELGPTIVQVSRRQFRLHATAGKTASVRSAERPSRLELRLAIDRNQHVRHERVHRLVHAAGVEPMLAVNLGTRGPQDAGQSRRVLQPSGGTALSDLRQAHGWDQPHGVKFWCLGNEMDGAWQTAVNSAEEYGRVALQAAKMMRWADDSIATRRVRVLGPATWRPTATGTRRRSSTRSITSTGSRCTPT